MGEEQEEKEKRDKDRLVIFLLYEKFLIDEFLFFFMEQVDEIKGVQGLFCYVFLVELVVIQVN